MVKTKDPHVSFCLWRMHDNIRDVTIQLGLRVNGMTITALTTSNTATLLQQCDYLLSARPGEDNVDEGFIRLQWLNEYYRLLRGNDDIMYSGWLALIYCPCWATS